MSKRDAPISFGIREGDTEHKCTCTVGIVGGGIAGLYTALLLKRQGVDFHIFEGTNRVGGRVSTHYFTQEQDQYFEAGAMRIPDSPFHKVTFDLIKYLNETLGDKKWNVDLIDYVLTMSGNEIYINNIPPGKLSARSTDSITPAMVNWEVEEQYKNKSAGELMNNAIYEQFQKPLLDAIKDDKFEEEFLKIIKKWDDYSFRMYLKNVVGYPTPVVDFLETITSQTNQFAISVPELVMQCLDFGETKWKTIDKGMSRLPLAMAELIGHDKITYGARVTAIVPGGANDGITITATGYNGQLEVLCSKVVFAIPPAALKMLIARPRWTPCKEMAIRSIHFEALYKMGLRFKRRFWEQVQPSPSNGGQSTTDLPIRWIVFPSNGIGSDGTGVLLIYAWMTDATTWVPLSPIERRSLALHNLEEMYHGRLGKDKWNRDITVADLLIETYDAVWSESTATGDAMYLPGQMEDRFFAARAPENDNTVFFAGEHLSFHHTWISGAADSALITTRLLLDKPNLEPLGPYVGTGGRGDEQPAPAHASAPAPEHTALPPFRFTPSNPLLLGDVWANPVVGGDVRHGPWSEHSDRGGKSTTTAYVPLPRSLGDGSVHPLGAQLSHLKSIYMDAPGVY